MKLIPVLEVRHGKGVHTAPKNRFANQVIKDDVPSLVSAWVEKGVSRIHLVDVDGIESGEPENVDLVTHVKKEFPALEIQVIGGINAVESAYIWLDAGVDFLVLSGKALRQRQLFDDLCISFPNQILVEVDCRGGKVALGCSAGDVDLAQFANQLDNAGVVGLVVTEVMAPQINSEEVALKQVTCAKGRLDSDGCIAQLVKAVDLPIFANGLVDSFSDLQHLSGWSPKRPSGLLIGKALYQENFCLSQAHQLIASQVARPITA